MPHKNIEKIREKLKEIEALLPTEPVQADKLSSYPNLKEAVIQQELIEAHQALLAWVDSDQDEAALKAAFRALCAARAKRNQNTALSFFAMPEGTCNQLYWTLAQWVFEPKTVAEMLTIVQPDIHEVVVPEVSLSSQDRNIPFRERLQLKLITKPIEETTVAALQQTPESSGQLTHFVCDKQRICPLEEVVEYDWRLHQVLYQGLDAEPALKAAIYAHNDDLAGLGLKLDASLGKGLTPRQALEQLSAGLKRGGTLYSGQAEATGAINQPFIRFQQFMDNLTEAQKAQLLALKTPGGRTLEAILGSLEKNFYQCVEQASKDIDALLAVPGNVTVLEHLCPEVASQLNPSERFQISPVGYADSLSFPSELTIPLLSKMTLRHIDDYLTLLISVPPEFYSLYFSQLKIDPVAWYELSPRVMEALTPQQRDAFLQCCIDYPDTFGGPVSVLRFLAGVDLSYIKIAFDRIPIQLDTLTDEVLTDLLSAIARNRNAESFEKIIMDIAPERRQAVLLKKSKGFYSLLLHVIGDTKLREIALRELVSEGQWLSDVLNNEDLVDLLIFAVKNEDAEKFKEIIRQIAPEKRQAVLLPRDRDFNIPLLLAIEDKALGKIALRELVSEEKPLLSDVLSNEDLTELLCTCDIELFEEIINQVAREKRQAVLLTEYKGLSYPLDFVVGDKNRLNAVLHIEVSENQQLRDVLSNEDLANALFIAVGQYRYLGAADGNIANLNELIKQIALEKRQAVFLTEVHNGVSPLGMAVLNKKILETLLNTEIAKGKMFSDVLTEEEISKLLSEVKTIDERVRNKDVEAMLKALRKQALYRQKGMSESAGAETVQKDEKAGHSVLFKEALKEEKGSDKGKEISEEADENQRPTQTSPKR